MTVATGLVLYAVLFCLSFLLVNPLWQTSQGEAGEVTPGTPESAPVDAMVVKKLILAACLAAVLWVVAYVIQTRNLIPLESFEWATPPSARE